MTNQTVQHEEVVVNDQKIAYTLTTSGENFKEDAVTFLLIHGAMGNSKTTADLAKQLSERFPTAAIFQVDLPGHGKSVGEPLQSIPEIAKLLKQFIADMKSMLLFTDNLVLVGHSMGGSIAMQLVLEGVSVKQLVLLSSSPEWSSMKPLNDIPNLEGVIEETFEYMMTEDFKVNTTPELQEKLNSQIKSMGVSANASVSDIQALIKFDIREQISEIEIPVLVVYGDNDPTATLENQKLMINTFPKATEALIPGASHTTVIKNFVEIADAIVQNV
jgi:pimeloyl-ACP methyl ester carboxylesterase